MNQTILVIDDDPVLNEGIANALAAAGFAPVRAASAEEALDMMKIMLFDGIILDRMMPGMDGVEFLKKIRAKDIRTPVLMLTALGDTDNTIAGLEAGADDYMGKPFAVKELILRIRNLLKNAPLPAVAAGIEWRDGEFFADDRGIPLSDSEKVALRGMTTPVGAIVAAAPMTIKRLREKLSGCKLGLSVQSVHGKGYKLVKR
ncbi:MAG: response regulator transcription factor [Rickettsiales bacterium]|jgi:DNA-binding response OmpR family regulator|nr:response regulator transcription factor [Rickettsiales bacterium]